MNMNQMDAWQFFLSIARSLISLLTMAPKDMVFFRQTINKNMRHTKRMSKKYWHLFHIKLSFNYIKMIVF